MIIDEYLKKRPYLYHLTARQNLDVIQKQGAIHSTVHLVELSDIQDKRTFLRTRRKDRVAICFGNHSISIRDQHPISLTALEKCLTDGWSCGDFLYHLNDQVFMWPTIKRLQKHYHRYCEENPVILKFDARHAFEKNVPRFSSLNSGATRPNSNLGGKAPARGKGTFKKAEDYLQQVASVAEVTFQGRFVLPESYFTSDNPDGPWQAV